jgi:hypothetical protein
LFLKKSLFGFQFRFETDLQSRRDTHITHFAINNKPPGCCLVKTKSKCWNKKSPREEEQTLVNIQYHHADGCRLCLSDASSKQWPAATAKAVAAAATRCCKMMIRNVNNNNNISW